MKEKYKAIIEKIEESKSGVKVLDQLTRYTYATNVTEAQRNITYHLNEERIYLGIDKNISNGDKIVKWEISRIDLERNYEQLILNNIDNINKEKVKDKIFRIKEKYNIEDRDIATFAKKIYGKDSKNAISNYVIYSIVNDTRNTKEDTLIRVNEVLNQIEKYLSNNYKNEEHKGRGKDKVKRHRRTKAQIEADNKTICFPMALDRKIVIALDKYLAITDLSYREYFEGMITKDLESKCDMISQYDDLIRKLRGDK